MSIPEKLPSFEHKMQELSEHLRTKEGKYVHLANTIRHYLKIPFYKPPVVDENLNLISRWGIQWWVISFLNPMFQVFGCDLLSSVRADRVAKGILNYFEKHKEEVKDKTGWIKHIEKKMLGRLDSNSHEKYHEKITQVQAQLRELFPEPVSTRPPEPVVAAPDPQVLVWPPKLSDLGIDAGVVAKVESVFASLRASLNSQEEELALTGEKDIPEYEGLKLRFFYDEKKLRDVMLITKQEFAKGGARTIYLCYNLTKGQYFIRKDSPREEERVLLRKLIGHSVRGLEPVFDVRRVSEDRVRSETWEIIERCKAGTLLTLFNTKPLMNFEQTALLVEDLVSALRFIHSQPKEVIFRNKYGDVMVQQSSLFHGDISPRNVLVEKEGKRWKAILSDFDAAGSFPALSGTRGFRSPEYIKFDGSKKTTEEIVRFNLENGQPKDIWSMGLIILTLLCGNKATGPAERIPEGYELSEGPKIAAMNIPPLPCLSRCFSAGSIYSPDYQLTTLIQNELNEDLDGLCVVHKNYHGENNPKTANLWELVKGMLKVDPRERITAQEAFRLLQNGKE